ncbi:MAG: hypothetical protein ALAOOOJD_02265 [bacterium]|nr:hypothetical protein [bacterium]
MNEHDQKFEYAIRKILAESYSDLKTVGTLRSS